MQSFARLCIALSLFKIYSSRFTTVLFLICCVDIIVRLLYLHLFTSNQIKSLLLSHHRSTSALVSEILTSVLQTVKKKKITYGQYIFTDCTEDNVQNTHTYTQYT